MGDIIGGCYTHEFWIPAAPYVVLYHNCWDGILLGHDYQTALS